MSALRLWIVRHILPRGYAVWTYGQQGDDGLDYELFVARKKAK